MLTILELEKRIRLIVNNISFMFKYDKNVPMGIVVENKSDLKKYCIQENISVTEIASSFVLFDKQPPYKIYRYTLLFNYDFWAKSSMSEINGAIAHELQHSELCTVFKESLIDPKISGSKTFGDCPLEKIVDILCVTKGFAEDLVRARRYTIKMASELDGINASDYEMYSFRNTNGLNLDEIVRMYGNNSDLLTNLL